MEENPPIPYSNLNILLILHEMIYSDYYLFVRVVHPLDTLSDRLDSTEIGCRNTIVRDQYEYPSYSSNHIHCHTDTHTQSRNRNMITKRARLYSVPPRTDSEIPPIISSSSHCITKPLIVCAQTRAPSIHSFNHCSALQGNRTPTDRSAPLVITSLFP